MRLKIALLFLLILAALEAHAVSIGIDPTQTGAIAISTSTITPTQLFTNDPAATRTYIVNNGSQTVWIVGMSASSNSPFTTPSAFSISTSTGSFYLVANSTYTFSPDGPSTPFTGPVWAVSQPGPGVSITRFRAH